MPQEEHSLPQSGSLPASLPHGHETEFTAPDFRRGYKTCHFQLVSAPVYFIEITKLFHKAAALNRFRGKI